jgi:hypothetical protein
MDYGIHADERSIIHLEVANVAGDERCPARKRRFVSIVNLVLERIDDYDVVAASDKMLDEVRADEARTSGDQDAHRRNGTSKGEPLTLTDWLDRSSAYGQTKWPLLPARRSLPGYARLLA